MRLPLVLLVAVSSSAAAADARFAYPAKSDVAPGAREECDPFPFSQPACDILAPTREALRGAVAHLFKPAEPSAPAVVQVTLIHASLRSESTGGGYRLTLAAEVEVA